MKLCLAIQMAVAPIPALVDRVRFLIGFFEMLLAHPILSRLLPLMIIAIGLWAYLRRRSC